jgi:hypothetical protein
MIISNDLSSQLLRRSPAAIVAKISGGARSERAESEATVKASAAENHTPTLRYEAVSRCDNNILQL